MDNLQQKIWLVGLRPNAAPGQRQPAKPGFWARLKNWLRRRLSAHWPRLLAQEIGQTADGQPVGLLELPYTKAEFRALPPEQRRQQLRKALNWLNQPQNRALRIGMPLVLQDLLPQPERPSNLANDWPLAAREFVGQLTAQAGQLAELQVALLGVENAHPAERLICDALLAAGAQPVLYGAHALGLAEYYYQKYGIALPVFGARKAIRSSRVIIVLNGRPNARPTAAPNGKFIFYFHEPHVSVPGRFKGRFSFGSFAAGQAAAMLNPAQDNS